MTYMTETGRTLASRRRSLDRSDAMWPMDLPTAIAGDAAPRRFTLRNAASALGGNQIEGRAFPKEDDS